MDCTLRSRCHLPRSVYHLACSRSRCVITLALLVSCWRYLQLSRLAGQLYVDVSRVRQGMDASGCATHVPIGEAYDVHSRALNWRLPYVCVRCISWRLSSQYWSADTDPMDVFTVGAVSVPLPLAGFTTFTMSGCR